MTDDVRDMMPAFVAAHADPTFFDSLSETAKIVYCWYWDFWLRPDQRLPPPPWRMCGLGGGRGTGKSLALGAFIDGEVRAGRESHIALMAPTEARVEQVQFKTLIDVAPPWDRPELRGSKKGLCLQWSNGVKAIGFTPESPDKPRSENISLTWMTEMVDWKASTRLEAFSNLNLATRVGPHPRLVWDTTSKGRNDLIDLLYAFNERDPQNYPVIHGTMFDNPVHDISYLRAAWQSLTGVRREEEILGRRFSEAAGALWRQEWINRSRVEFAPDLETEIVSLDPALSLAAEADETGIMREGRARDGHVYVLEDRTGKHAPEEWGDIAIALADPRKTPSKGRVSIELNHVGQLAVSILRSRAEGSSLLIRTLAKDEPWPAHDPRCIFVREQWAREAKDVRAAGPAAEHESGRVHHVGVFEDLEKEMTTFVPGTGQRSPNRYDAHAYAVIELRELARDASNVDRSADVAAAMAMHEELQRRLSGADARRPQGEAALLAAVGRPRSRAL